MSQPPQGIDIRTAHPGRFGILADPRAWRALAFMLFAAVTGPFLFVWAAVAMALIVNVWIAAMAAALLFLASLRPLSWLEGRLATFLLDVRLPRTQPSLAYMLLRLPLGLVYFALALICLLVPGAFLWAGAWGVSGQVTVYPPDPFLAKEPVVRGILSGQFLHETAGSLHVHAAPGWLMPWLQQPALPGAIALAIGILLFVPLLHLVYVLGQAQGKIAERMLAPPQASGADASSEASAATMT